MWQEACIEDLERFHGLFEAYNVAAAVPLRENLASVITQGRRGDYPLRAQLLGWEADGKVVGGLVNSEILPGRGNALWLLGVFPEFRGQGHGGRLLDAAVGVLRPHVDVFLSCGNTLGWVHRMAERRGFAPIGQAGGGASVLCCPRGSAGNVRDAPPGVQELPPFRLIPVPEGPCP